MMPRLVADASAPDAPYPSDMAAKGWRFSLDYERIEQSDTWALATPDMRPWLLMLWMTAWRQVPCGSLPASDDLIAARLGMPARQFQANRDILLRGWVLHADGRMYHPTITEQVSALMTRRRADQARVQAWREKQGCNALPTRDQHISTTPEPEPEPKKDIEATPLVASAAPKPPSCPTGRIVEAFHAALPMLPRVSVLSNARRAAVSARWREVVTTDKLDEAGGLEFFAWFFGHVAQSAFLTGKTHGHNGRCWRADFDWLMKPTNFAKTVEGNYHK